MKRHVFASMIPLFFAVMVAAMFLASPAYADDVVMTMSPSSLTFPENGSLSIVFTITNTSATETIGSDGFSSTAGSTISGDPTDLTGSGSFTFAGPGSCPNAPFNLAPGQSCHVQVTFTGGFISENSGGETDADSGVTPISVDFAYCVFVPGGPCVTKNGTPTGPLWNVSENVNMTVTDPVPTTTAPEPPSGLLLGAGFVLLTMSLRRKREGVRKTKATSIFTDPGYL